MVKNLMQISRLSILFLTIILMSCSGEDGMDGAIGPQGEQGIAGVDGQDGNANVRSFTYDLTEFLGSGGSFSLPELTADVLANDVILAYLQLSSFSLGEVTYPLPSRIWERLASDTILKADVDVFYTEGNIAMLFYEQNTTIPTGVFRGDLKALRIVIIESTSNTSSKTTKSQVMDKLKVAGVDINDYKALMNHFVLEY